MSDYFFALGSGHLPKKAQKIAEKHGADLVNYTEPDGRKRHWFACDNYGEPHDSQVRQAVVADLEKAGLI
jgi:Fe-S oxidoreductase